MANVKKDTRLNKDDLVKTYKVGEQNLLFKLEGNRQTLILRSLAKRTEGAEVYKLRYSSKDSSPFIEDQPNQVEVDHIVFDNTVKMADKNDPCLQLYLLMHPGCTLNGGREFRLVNEEEDAQKELDALEIRDEAIDLIKNENDEEILRAAITYIKHISYSQLERLEISRLRLMLRREAESNPQKVIDAFNSEITEVVSNYNIAKKLEIILFNPVNGDISWNNGPRILPVAPGQFDVEEFYRFTGTAHGKKVYETIKQKLES